MKYDPDLGALLEGLDAPEPPTTLRASVLSAAGQALDEGASDPWARLWHRRGLRLAWSVTVALLLVGHVLLPVLLPASPAQPSETETWVGTGAALSRLESDDLLTIFPIRLNSLAFSDDVSGPDANRAPETPNDLQISPETHS